MRSTLRFISVLAIFAAFSVSAIGSTMLVAGESVPARLKWKTREITIAISSSLTRPSSNIINGSDVYAAVRNSLATWEEAADVKFNLVDSDRLNVSPAGVRGDGVNLITVAQSPENVLLFEHDPESVSATTRVFYNKRNTITEADIVLNPYQQFSTNGTFGTYDLQSALTHEIGHLLGLRHSIIPGSTMFDHYGKNGLFGMPNFNARTLSMSDIISVSALYGPKETSEDCCALVRGTISEPRSGREIWIEDETTGQILQAVDVSNAETFEFGDLNDGIYKLYSQGNSVATNTDAFEISAGEMKKIELPNNKATSKGTLRFIGLNGELSDQSITLNAGRTYSVYVGGQGFENSKAKIGIDSPFFTVYRDTNLVHNYGESVLVMSSEIRVDSNTPSGLYSVYIEFQNGDRYYLPGAISVESFENPWGSTN